MEDISNSNPDSTPAESYVVKKRFLFSTKTWLIILGVIFLVLILFLANYFFNKQKPQPEIIAQLTPTPTPIITLPCPVPKEFCSKGSVIDNGEVFYGMYFTLPLEASLSAVFAGEVSDQPKPAGRLATEPLLYLKGNQGLEAIYSFYGSPAVNKSKSYSESQIIGKIGKGQFPQVAQFGGSNFLFSVKQNNKFIKFQVSQ